ncbi:MAG: methyltransferase [Candidatus Thermoplasmatota archaeon]|nr:methyltransferase [Candidatus Thermoplasmatota archaeon]MCL5791256.1 methyltransferase [Candidatus Thermoplasmatota archaeon]
MERIYEMDGTEIRLEICPGVYEPSDDTFLLARSSEPVGRCLEIGSGSGFISIYLALNGIEISCTDINQKAVECIRGNMVINGVSFPCVRSDLFSNVSGIFDTIIFNPPYLPTDDRIEGSEQWDGGQDGFAVIRKFLRGSEKYLSPNGRIFTILSSLTDIESLISEFPQFSFIMVAERNFFFESIFAYSLTRRI